jgi:hypothetical protein
VASRSDGPHQGKPWRGEERRGDEERTRAYVGVNPEGALVLVRSNRCQYSAEGRREEGEETNLVIVLFNPAWREWTGVLMAHGRRRVVLCLSRIEWRRNERNEVKREKVKKQERTSKSSGTVSTIEPLFSSHRSTTALRQIKLTTGTTKLSLCPTRTKTERFVHFRLFFLPTEGSSTASTAPRPSPAAPSHCSSHRGRASRSLRRLRA